MSKLHVAAAAAASPLLFWPLVGANSTAPQTRAGASAAESPPAAAPASFWWADFDADRLLDAYVVQEGGAGRLLRNRGDGAFDDVTERAGLGEHSGAHMALWADFDADGRLDLYLASSTGASALLRQLEAGTFEDVSALSGLPADARPSSAAWRDYDADGLSDLHLSCATGEALYHNEGAGRFARVALELGSGVAPIALPPLVKEPEPEVAPGAPAPAPSATSGRTALSPPPTPGPVSAGAGGSGTLPGTFTAACSPGVEDQAGGACIEASRTPTLDRLYPLSEDLYVDAATGRVGIGTTSPTRRLHVDGRVYAEATGVNFSAFRGVSQDGKAFYGESYSDSYPAAHFQQFGGDHILECDTASGLTAFRARGFGGIYAQSDVGTNDVSESSSVYARNTSPETGHALYAWAEGTGSSVRIRQDGTGSLLRADSPSGTVLTVRNEGGITSTCTNGSNNLGLSTALYATNTSTDEGNAILGRTTGIGTTLLLQQHGTGQFIKATDSNGDSLFRVTNTGRVVTTALQITGGGDLVEGFDAGEDELEPGTVVVIDPDQPGRVRASAGAYDAKVAGAISGAGGVEHGIRMGQDGVLDGEALVAMTGRIYVKCSAENGPIAPGDLLTSAELAGHAMKATDPERAFGAVIGKAMTSLDEGTGLVLVLVNLQ